MTSAEYIYLVFCLHKTSVQLQKYLDSDTEYLNKSGFIFSEINVKDVSEGEENHHKTSNNGSVWGNTSTSEKRFR